MGRSELCPFYILFMELGLNNRQYLKKDKICGCYACLTIFKTVEIEDWLDKKTTAVCPYCGMDAIVSESCGYKPTEKILKLLHNREFGDK